MPNPMTQEQLVDICRLMDINKDGLVDLNEFLESFRLAEKSLQDDDFAEITTTWQESDRRLNRTAVDKHEIDVEVEVLILDDGGDKSAKNDKNGRGHLMGECVLDDAEGSEEIKLIDCEDTPKRPGLLESDI